MCVRQPSTTEFMKSVIHIGIFERALQHMSSFLNSRKMWQISNNSFSAINPIVGGGGQMSPLGFSCAFAKPLEISSSNFQILRSIQCKHSVIYFGPRLGQSPGQVRWPFLKKWQLRHGYSSRRISMKLTGLFSVFSTYKMYLSYFFPCNLRSGTFRDLSILSLGEILTCDWQGGGEGYSPSRFSEIYPEVTHRSSNFQYPPNHNLYTPDERKTC